MNLHEQTRVAKRLLDQLELHDLLGDDPVMRAAVLESETELTETLSRLIVEDAADEAQAASLDQVMSQLSNRRDRIMARKDRRRAMMLWAMGECGLKSLPTPAGTLIVPKVGMKLVMEGDADVERLPPEFVKTTETKSPIKSLIRAALDEGLDVPGYRLSNGEPSLTIRSK